MKMRMKRSLVLCIAMIIMLASSVTVFATSITTAQADTALQKALQQGHSSAPGSSTYSGKVYEKDGGGYATWTELFDSTSTQTGYVNESTFNTLTSNAKKQYLEDLISVSNDVVDSTTNNEAGVTNTTQTNWLNNLQNCSGVGSQLMTTLLANTKPDYVTANRIYEPFSGVVGTVLGLGAILIMAFLAITMVLDLSYIGIPAFRMLCDGDGDGSNGGQNGGKPKFISYEAVSAVQMAEGGNGGAGQNGGSNKAAVGIYFKKRVVMLCILGICLLYLIQGQIFTLVGWLLDLVSGFLGF